MENRHWNIIMKFQLFSFPLLRLFFFARSDQFILPESFISQFNDSLTTTSTLKDNQTINQMFYMPSFLFSGYILKRIETSILGGELRCGCLMDQKWTIWPLRAYSCNPTILWTLASFVPSSVYNNDESNNQHNTQPCGLSDLLLINVGSSWPTKPLKSVN